MQYNKFGKTDLLVSNLGFGAGQIGDDRISDLSVEKILNSVLDYGINLFDTARAYGLSETRIGKFLKHRRSNIILSTKVGYDIPGFENWTFDIIIAGVDQALKLLQTDYIDIVHLHSCDLKLLKDGAVIDALQKVKEQGKIRCMAYSGENEELAFAVTSNRFDSIQTSVNICDQRDIEGLIPLAKEQEMGVIAKRPLANAPWLYQELPKGFYVEEYWKRWKKMDMNFDLAWDEIALRFCAFSTNADCCIAGTANPEHLKNNVQIVEKGPLPSDIVDTIKQSFKKHDENWIGEI